MDSPNLNADTGRKGTDTTNAGRILHRPKSEILLKYIYLKPEFGMNILRKTYERNTINMIPQ